MSTIDHRYDFAEIPNSQVITYLFFSEMRNNEDDIIAKIIQYNYIRNIEKKPVFNLGFGNFDKDTGEVDDMSVTASGDAYKIFNTVLSTIPRFFRKHPQAAILVRGSDGQAEFETKCKLTCVKKCEDVCNKFNRRMKLYCNYVSRKLSIFEGDYHFLGGKFNNSYWFDFEDFEPGKLYDSIVMSKK